MHFPHRVCALVFLGLLVPTHSSEMTTTGNKGDSSKRGAQRRGQLLGDGGAPAGDAVQDVQRGTGLLLTLGKPGRSMCL